MENVLEGLPEPSALSPLSTHVDDFTALGDSHEEVMGSGQLTSEHDESLSLNTSHGTDPMHALKVEDIDTVHSSPPALCGPPVLPDMDLSVTPGLGQVDHLVGQVDGLVGQVGQVEPGAALQEAQGTTPVVLTSEGTVLTSDPATLISSIADTQLIQTGAEGEGILLTTDADGNLSVPLNAEQVIRLFMHSSDQYISQQTWHGQFQRLPGDVDGTQVLSLTDGTATLLTQAKPEEVNQGRQAIKLENGTTALLQPTPNEALQEGLQAIQLEDGSTAFITHPSPEALFSMEGLTLDTLTSQTILGTTESLKDKHNTDKQYKCLYEDCGRLYTTQHHLKVHERSHTGDRPFICEFPSCGKAFATGYGLKSHNRVHTGEKPYPCTEAGCEKAFKTSGDLQKHVRTHTGERPFKCPFEGCTRSFTTSNIRKVHIRTHTGERPYICDMEGCGRAFASATNYKNHIRIHTGEKPYVCTVQDCGKRFTEYSSLYKHHVVHTHTKPYTCATCGKTYRQTSTLAMHKRTAHGEEFPADLSEADLRLTSESATGEPPAKKRMMVKTEVTGDPPAPAPTEPPPGGEGAGHMVLLTSPAPPPHDGVRVSLDDSTAQLMNLATLQQSGISGLASLPLGDGGQQVLVVTDPAQLEALQNLAAQHLTSLTAGMPDSESAEDNSAGPGVSMQGSSEVSPASLGQ